MTDPNHPRFLRGKTPNEVFQEAVQKQKKKHEKQMDESRDDARWNVINRRERMRTLGMWITIAFAAGGLVDRFFLC